MKQTMLRLFAVLLAAILMLGMIACTAPTRKDEASPILIEAKDDANNLNLAMATFLLWQTMYQQAYYEWYYTSWGLYEDIYGITKTYSSAASYGIAKASAYTNEQLREGIERISYYLIELVAGADAATAAGLAINDADMKEVEEIKTWLKNVYLNSGHTGTYQKFLKEMIGDGVTERNVEAAAKLVVLYTKYCNYAKLNLDNDPTEDILQAFIEKNPAGRFEISYQQYKNADDEFLVKLFRNALAEKYDSEYKALVTEEEYEQILKDLIKAKSSSESGNYYAVFLSAMEEIEELSVDTDTFREMVVNDIVDNYFMDLVIEKFLIRGVIKDAEMQWKTAFSTGTGLDELLAGVEIKQYIKNKQDPLSAKYPKVAEWAYDASRVAGEWKIFDDDSSFYVAYIDTPATDAVIGADTLKTVKVAMKEYSKTGEYCTLIDALGYTEKPYKESDETIPAEIKAWLFADERAAGDVELIKVTKDTKTTFYLAYAFSAPTADGETKTIKANYTAITLTTKQYVNNGKDVLATDYATIANWAYNVKRAAGDTAIFTIDETVYLVYVNKALSSTVVADTFYSYVSIAMIPYTLADAPDSEWILSQKDLLISDLIKDENSTNFDSADDKAKVLYELLAGENGDKTRWYELVADLEVKKDTVNKPASGSSTTTAVQDVLYAGPILRPGDIFQVDDNGTSYVLKITKVSGTTYEYDYVTYTDDEYYEFFRALKNALTAYFAKEPTTLLYPDALSTASNRWLFKGKYDEETKKYTFDREVGDAMHFAVTTTANNVTTETGYYNVYIVTNAPAQDKNEEKTVYGGYLLFKVQQEAEKAMNSLSGLKGFDLWHAFAALSVTTGEGENATVTNSMLDTAFTKDDIKDDALENWLFADERKSDEFSLVKGADGYYLAYYYSAEATWTREAKDPWVSAQLETLFNDLVQNGGYTIKTNAIK